jgi:hypothetical protein
MTVVPNPSRLATSSTYMILSSGGRGEHRADGAAAVDQDDHPGHRARARDRAQGERGGVVGGFADAPDVVEDAQQDPEVEQRGLPSRSKRFS